jgi:hypothetical protein
MLTIQLVKTVMVASTALFALLVAYHNVADYGSNYEFVRHTLSMDTTFPDTAVSGQEATLRFRSDGCCAYALAVPANRRTEISSPISKRIKSSPTSNGPS